MVSSRPPSPPDCIRLRGVRQNNLKGFDLDLPLGHYIVVTGLSGAGKSSLVFDTLHAEGQRRYVETFSAYTRQFLELLDKPVVDEIENIRPSIAIQQSNTVKTSRSTVGTMTELTDYAKVWFSQVARCYDPESGQPVEDDTPGTIWQKASAANPDQTAVVTFRIDRPEKISWAEILQNLRGQAYVRVLLPARRKSDGLTAHRVDELQEDEKRLKGHDHLYVAQDRVTLSRDGKGRFLEAAETALHFGQGQLHLFGPKPDGTRFEPIGHYSRGLHSPTSGRTFRPASPALFSFNSPLGACPHCRGFGRVIEIDYRLAIPDRTKSIEDGAIKAWEGQVYGESKKDLMVFAEERGIPTDIPFADLTAEQQAYVIEGEPGYGEDGKEWPRAWYGVKGFFDWLEKNTYKMHVRVFLSRFRAYNPCPDCGGSRLQPESLCWKWRGHRLPDLYTMPVGDLLGLIQKHPPKSGDHQSELAHQAMVTRLSYLDQVGLGYLTLDRPSKTLSGGEVERVNLTSCLGTSLVDTLFVLDEPSVGLHPRDIDRLIAIIRDLTDAGNTVVVVEHDEAMIAAADHVIEIGPEPGQAGGQVVFQGDVPALLESTGSITGRYLSGRAKIEAPAEPRRVRPRDPHLIFKGITQHNLRNVNLRLPLNRFVCLSGVSGSGKSTLLDYAIHRGLLQHRHQATEDAAEIKSITGDEEIGEIVLVDQSPISRTPRSNPALFCEAWDEIRTLYAREPSAVEAGFTPASFSFNAGDGRCDHCQGLGYERVEMQFLSDVFVPCPICEGKRFKPEVLAVTWNGHSIADMLATTITDALPLFAEKPTIQSRLRSLEQVGLGYLPLGQPLNTLSGGEAQRLKLVKYLGGLGKIDSKPALLLLDEPTTGLHRHDVRRLLDVLQELVEGGHSVVVIEHNLDVLKSADWLIEIGPEAGAAGGRIIAEGPPRKIAERTGKQTTATTPYLAEALAPAPAPAECHLLSDTRHAAEPVGARRLRGDGLSIVGARENNLKNLSLTLPAKELAVVTGVSGSGKSTLAFDIVFAEGQRRFMESMSAYARQFVEQLPRPAIDHLGGIPPTVAIEQRVTRGSRKSTVATITEVAQYLRLLYARIGIQHHPETDNPVRPLRPTELEGLLDRVLRSSAAKRSAHLYLCAPLVRGRKGHHEPIAKWIARQGFELMRTDGKVYPVEAFTKLDRYKEHDVEVIVADLKHTDDRRTALREALRLGKGACFLLTPSGKVLSWFSTTRTDLETGESFPELDPKHFSHNSPRGWCPTCRGHGRVFGWMLRRDDEEQSAEIADISSDLASLEDTESTLCPDCLGARLNPVVRAVKLHFKGRQAPLSLPQLLAGTASELLDHLRRLKTTRREELILRDILPQIEERLKFLDHVGLGYLTLDRPTATLSGGEAQRIRLAAQLGTNLAGVLYVLDEPSIGLHARDNDRLIATLESLRDKGNSLLVVEHDDELMLKADRIVDLGPGAGQHGGELLAMGTPDEIKSNRDSLTGLFLDRGITHPLRGKYRPLPPAKSKERWIELTQVRFRNLQGFDLRLPLGRLILAAGPSGAGKSTLFRGVLRPAIEAAIKTKRNRLTGKSLIRSGGFPDAEEAVGHPPFGELRGKLPFRSVIEVDQSPIGKTPRSTPATYLGIFDLIRQFFASLPEARMRGYNASRFSFNTPGGRCETCKGAGRIKLEMAFMPDTYLDCEDCGGSRFGPELNDITWNDRTIGQVLQMTFEEAAEFFSFHSRLGEVCQLMVDCGLGYLSLGQSSPTLSGGEAQRLKLITELAKGLATYTDRKRGALPQNLYLLEEPTIGLHLSDCEKLIHLLHNLVDQGHTVVVIEHQLDLIAEADYVVELGPDGGPGGGRLIHQGTLPGLLKKKRSVTAPYLKSKIGDR